MPVDLGLRGQCDPQLPAKKRRRVHSIPTGLAGDARPGPSSGLANPKVHDNSPQRAGDVLSLSPRHAIQEAPSRAPLQASQPQVSGLRQIAPQESLSTTQIQAVLTLEQCEALHTRITTKLNQLAHGQAIEATSLFAKRLASLEDACKRADVSFLVIHRLFCLWSLGTADAQHVLHQFIEPETAHAAFKRLIVYLRSNSPPNLSVDQLELLANYPADVDWDYASISASQRGQYFTQASHFLGTFAQTHDKVQRRWLTRGYPPLADELLAFFKLTSPVLQEILFRSYRRRLTKGRVAERHHLVLAMDKFFAQDQENHRDKYGLMHAASSPSDVGEIENRYGNTWRATAYRSLINAAIGQSNSSSAPSVSLSQQHQQILLGQLPNNEALVAFNAQQHQPSSLLGQNQGPEPCSDTHFELHQIKQPQVPAQQSEQLPQIPNLAQAEQASQWVRQHTETFRALTPLQNHAQLTRQAKVQSAAPIERQTYQTFSRLPPAQMRTVSPPGWVFPGRQGQAPPSRQTPEVQSLRAALPPTSIQQVTCPSFRHAQLRQNQQVAAQLPRQSPVSQRSAIFMPSTTPSTRLTTTSPRQPVNMTQYPSQMRFQQTQSNAQLVITCPVGATTAGQPVADQSFRAHDDGLILASQIPHDPHMISSIMGPFHRILAKSPDLAPAQAQTKPFRYYQYVKDFPFYPSPILPSQDLYQGNFNVSPDEFSRVIESNYSVGCRVPLSKFESGSLRYRLKSAAVTEDSCMTPGRWVTTEVEWPKHIFIRVNNRSFIHPCHESGCWKDLPIELEKSVLQPGKNEIAVSLPFAAGVPSGITFHIAVELIEFQKHGELINHIKSNQVLDVGESRLLIQRKVSGASLDDEIAVISTGLSVDLADPWSSTIWRVPVRGRDCTHVECFDLETWLTSRPVRPCLHGKSHHFCSPDCQSAEPSLIDKWKCPICNGDARPLSLVIDGFLLAVRDVLAKSNKLNQVKSIWICADGTWQPKAVEEDNDDADVGEARGLSRTGTTRAPAAPARPTETIEVD